MKTELDCGMRLVQADADDLRYIAECIRESILLSVSRTEAELSDSWMQDTLMIAMDSLSNRRMSDEAFVLLDGGERRGILWMGISRDQYTCEETGYLLGIYVEPAYRGKGIGSELLGCAEQWCRDRGLLSMALDAGAANAGACGFYAKHGYSARSVVLRKPLI